MGYIQGHAAAVKGHPGGGRKAGRSGCRFWHELGWGEELERHSIEQTNAADMILFGSPSQAVVKVKLLEARAFQTGCVLLRYEPAPSTGA